MHDAFLDMQRAAHIGKIVVRPRRSAASRPVPEASFTARAEGVHLVVGGTSGFGFATARWLAERGARTVVVGACEPDDRHAAGRAGLRVRESFLRRLPSILDRR